MRLSLTPLSHNNLQGHAMKRETLALHHGYAPDDQHSVAVPIHQTTSFSFDSAQHAADLFDLKVEGNIYSRIMNPTCAVLEQRVAALEGGIAGLAVASGMAAITYAIQTIRSEERRVGKDGRSRRRP